MLLRPEPFESDLPPEFHSSEMDQLIFTLLSDTHHFLDALKKADLNTMQGGDPDMKARTLSPAFKVSANPSLPKIATVFRAYPHAAKKLFLWAEELSLGVADQQASIKSDDKIMEFFASVGFLNERATGPADSVFETLGLEKPDRLNRLRTQRRDELLMLQRSFP